MFLREEANRAFSLARRIRFLRYGLFRSALKSLSFEAEKFFAFPDCSAAGKK